MAMLDPTPLVEPLAELRERLAVTGRLLTDLRVAKAASDRRYLDLVGRVAALMTWLRLNRANVGGAYEQSRHIMAGANEWRQS